MDNLERATKIRRTVTNKAYQLLKDCREPESIFDGYDTYDQEHWDIDYSDLHQYVLEELDKELDFKEGDGTDRQITFHCKHFLQSDEYKAMKDEIRKDYYQDQEDRKAIAQTNRAHQPSWRP